MKKLIIATAIGLAMQISGSEAQTSPSTNIPENKQHTEPPPLPPPPPVPPTPPKPITEIPGTEPILPQLPVPPVPPNAPTHGIPEPPPPPPIPPVASIEEIDYKSSIENVQDSAKVMIPENEKGFVVTVRRENRASVVVIRKNGVILRKVLLKDWLADSKNYEGLYGKLPPPPPPPAPPPPAPPKKND